MPTLRIAAPCTENYAAMQKTERGSFCEKCQHEVVDLRRTPRKKALTVLADLRRRSTTGRVCARVMAAPTGVPVFRPDPPGPLARLAAPLALVTSLAACAHAPEGESSTTPIAWVEPVSGPVAAPAHGTPSGHVPTAGNQNGPATTTPIATTTVTSVPTATPPQGGTEPMIEMMGEMAYEGP